MDSFFSMAIRSSSLCVKYVSGRLSCVALGTRVLGTGAMSASSVTAGMSAGIEIPDCCANFNGALT